MASKFSGFKYTGGGYLFLPGIPARNLTYDEVKSLDVSKKELLASGIYEEVPAEEEAAAPAKSPAKPDSTTNINSNSTESKAGGNS